MGSAMVKSKSTVKSSPAKGKKADSPIPHDALRRMYRNMLLTRRLDEKMLIMLKQGKSFFHIGASGHEAAQIALAANMRGGQDWAYPYYRGLSFCIEFGMTTEEVLLCFLAKEGDPNSGGRQMPAHYGHRGLRIVSQSSPTGTQYLQAVGTGMAIKRDGSDQVVMVSSGEGTTTSQGDFHEALNWAAREKAPVIFLIEDNNYAISVPIHQQTAGASVYDMCNGYEGLDRVEVDGTDLFASYEVMEKAVARARKGEGPTLVVANVVRLLPHSSSDNHAKYRTSEELEADKERDPIPRLEAELIRLGVYKEDELEAVWKEVKAEVDRIAEETEEAAYPDPSTAQHHVFSTLEYEAPEGA